MFFKFLIFFFLKKHTCKGEYHIIHTLPIIWNSGFKIKYYLINSSNFFNKSPYNFFLLKLNNVLLNLFGNNANVLFIDYDYNYNYLPISNQILFSRSSKNLYKFISFFKISAIIYLNIKKKKFILKKLIKLGLINISANTITESKRMDICLNLHNSDLYNYMLYTFILKIYLKSKSIKI